MTPLRLKVIKTLLYADIFDFPLRLGELKFFLISSSCVSLPKIEKLMRNLVSSGVVEEGDGFYFLKGKERNIALRESRRQISRDKFDLASALAKLLLPIGWIKGIFVTGGCSFENAKIDDDIDWLIITGPKRLWLTRILVSGILFILKKRRWAGEKDVRNKICLNMFLTEDSLRLPGFKQNLFTAHEVLQVKPLWQREGVYFRFIKNNSWAKRYLANAYFDLLDKNRVELSDDKVGFKGVRLLFDFLEKSAFCIQRKIMAKKRTKEVVELERAFFHPQDFKEVVIPKFEKRLAKFLNL